MVTSDIGAQKETTQPALLLSLKQLVFIGSMGLIYHGYGPLLYQVNYGRIRQRKGHHS